MLIGIACSFALSLNAYIKCSHLFWPKSIEGVERYSDPDRVLECMQRALKIASSCNPNLFVEILDR